jgi:hypothetical protein
MSEKKHGKNLGETYRAKKHCENGEKKRKPNQMPENSAT